MQKKGFIQIRIDNEIQEIISGMRLDRYKNHNIEVVIDKLKVSTDEKERITKSVEAAMRQGDGLIMILDKDTDETRYFSKRLMCPTTGMAYKDPAPNIFSFNSPEGACPYCKGMGFVNSDDPLAEIEETNEEGKEFDLTTCPACNGQRLCQESLSYKIHDKNIMELADMEIDQLHAWLQESPKYMTERQATIAEEILKEILTRLTFMLDVGLNYLSLSRHTRTLSGGESQRIRLATQIGSQLVNVLYILDEPSIGLHQRDNNRLITSLKSLRDIGNTVIVVEHDKDMMLAADYIVDIGPKAGRKGGEVVYQGKVNDMLQKKTITAEYLNKTRNIDIPSCRREGK